jgi:hypothetical protein
MSSIVSRVVRNSVRRVSGRVAQRPARSVKVRNLSTQPTRPDFTINPQRG